MNWWLGWWGQAEGSLMELYVFCFVCREQEDSELNTIEEDNNTPEFMQMHRRIIQKAPTSPTTWWSITALQTFTVFTQSPCLYVIFIQKAPTHLRNHMMKYHCTSNLHHLHLVTTLICHLHRWPLLWLHYACFSSITGRGCHSHIHGQR